MGEESRTVEMGEVEVLPPTFSSFSSKNSGSEWVSSPGALAVIRVALQAYLLCFCASNFSSWAWFSSRYAVSSCKVTPRGTLQVYVRPCKQSREW
jgi:hypothetical protein